MKTFIPVLAVLGLVAGVYCSIIVWYTITPARPTVAAVEAALEEVVSPESTDHDRWDLFLARRITDARLEAIRQECLDTVRQDRPAAGEDLPADGVRRIDSLLSRLRRANSSGAGTQAD